jgi:hypothetical protein
MSYANLYFVKEAHTIIARIYEKDIDTGISVVLCCILVE